MGDPEGLDDPNAEPPSYEELCNDTHLCYRDMDAGPTKAWMIHHRGEEGVQRLFKMGFGKFPPEELYDLRVDPHHMSNVVENTAYRQDRQRLAQKLEEVQLAHADPRVVEPDCRFERSPYTDV